MTMANSLASSFILLLPIFLLLISSLSEASNRSYIELNEIDRCWRNDPNWAQHRSNLAWCSVGFAGKMGYSLGNNVTYYEVRDSSDHPTEPKKGTLRYGTSKIPGRVWITFKHSMKISLKMPMMVSSYTFIDGRGANVQITRGGFLLYQVHDVIIHGLRFNKIIKTAGHWVTSKNGPQDLGTPEGYDAIRLVSVKKVWIDHNYLSSAQDGLIDAQMGSTEVTISNNKFTKHDKVMLLGRANEDKSDDKMRVTVVYNQFGPHCTQRMPRVRRGYVHVVNNLYKGWGKYAIGAEMHPRILTEGNKFIPSSFQPLMWKKSTEQWHLQTRNNIMVKGTNFALANLSISTAKTNPDYNSLQRFTVQRASLLELLTKDAGALKSCRIGRVC